MHLQARVSCPNFPTFSNFALGYFGLIEWMGGDAHDLIFYRNEGLDMGLNLSVEICYWGYILGGYISCLWIQWQSGGCYVGEIKCREEEDKIRSLMMLHVWYGMME